VVVNDLAIVGVDGELVARGGAAGQGRRLHQVPQGAAPGAPCAAGVVELHDDGVEQRSRVVELSGGCICCSLRGDLLLVRCSQ
jgi:hypothetical protein